MGEGATTVGKRVCVSIVTQRGGRRWVFGFGRRDSSSLVERLCHGGAAAPYFTASMAP